MKLIFPAIVIFVLAVLSHSNYTGSLINYSLIFLWLVTWLSSKERSLTYAIGLGIVFDLLSFLPFGFWTLFNVAVINFIDYLKTNYLAVSSFVQAVLVLAISTAIFYLMSAAVSGEFNYLEVVYGVIANAIIGGVIYYLLATHLRMVQRWSGRIL